MFFFYLYSKQKILNIYKKNVDEKKIWKIAFDLLKDIKLIDIIENKTMQGLFKYRRSTIPYRARISRKSNIFKLRYKNMYDIEIQTATFYYKERNMYSKYKSSIIIFENSCVIKMDLKKIQPNHSFSIFNQIIYDRSMSKVKLESYEFNKNFNINSNNKIKIRMIYTPLTMERTLNLYNEIPIRDIKIQKINNKVIINFLNISEQLESNFKFYKNVDKTVDVFFENLFKDVYSIYQLLGFLIIPPLL